MGNKQIMLSHLQSADDTWIFCPNNLDCLQNWWDFVTIFSNGVGLSQNTSKSSLEGINIGEEIGSEEAALLGCKMISLLIISVCP